MPKGGPNGGNGGNGGNVYLQADPNITTLLDIGRRHHYIAENGQPGQGSNKTGRTGKDLLVKLPIGTRPPCANPSVSLRVPVVK